MSLVSFVFAVALQSPPLAVATLPSPEVPRDADCGTLAPVDELLDDAIPLPEPAQWEECAGGDRRVAAPSGDPFFLGFASGSYYPAADERLDPQLALAAWAPTRDARPDDVTYGFVMFSKRMTRERFAALERLGARVLEFQPFYCVKAALPRTRLDEVAALDFVRWVGVARPQQKLDVGLASSIAALHGAEPLAVVIDVSESDLCAASSSVAVGVVEESNGDDALPGNDEFRPRQWMSNGWQQHALEAHGVELLEYIDSLHAFRATLDPARLEELAELDFVQFIEPVRMARLQHDESMPMVEADRTRASYDGSTNSVAIAGLIDSGFYLAHSAIDPVSVGFDLSSDATGPFVDGCGHGTHVCGTLLGNGDVNASYAGVAPGLGWGSTGRFYAVRIGNSDCTLSTSYGTMASAMHTPYTDPGGNTTPIPMVVGCSWGVFSSAAYGTDFNARVWDAEVFDRDQQYVFAAGNSGSIPGQMDLEGAAKNVISVGSVYDWDDLAHDPGAVAQSSSRGPTADGRWKPNVCAPGDGIHSCVAGTATGYAFKTGTSTAQPHVAGIAAQLCDHYSGLRYHPAALSAVLMASAVTRSNLLLTSPTTSAAHLNAYGTGRVDAYKAHFSDSQQSLYFWNATLAWNQSTSVDFPISAGATRVTIVVHYKEQEAPAGGVRALINDLDSFIDASPFQAGNNTGDYTAQQSSLDNTEVRSLDNPLATTWRIKVYPSAMIPFQSVKVGICAIVTYGDTTPTPVFAVTTTDAYVKPFENTTCSAFYFNPS